MSVRIRVYFAGPLFTQAEWQWNERLALALEARSLSVLLPQRTAEPMLKGIQGFDPRALFQANTDAIEQSDVVVAIFDGPDVDSGTAWECGYAFKMGRPVIGVRSDIRAGGDDAATATNLMLSMSSAELVSIPFAVRDDVDFVADRVSETVQRVHSARE
jgi:nucleoside 2-deoxyribosyltransferase